MSHPTVQRLAAGVLLGLIVSACGRPEDPIKNQADVAKAVDEGQARVDAAAVDAMKDHLDRVADADGKPLGAPAMKKDVDAIYKVDKEVADANLKVDREKCQALGGAERDRCLRLADSDHDAALATAEAKRMTVKAEIEKAQPPAKP